MNYENCTDKTTMLVLFYRDFGIRGKWPGKGWRERELERGKERRQYTAQHNECI
jgi:hypothetical protein